jgi:hypothetical protein
MASAVPHVALWQSRLCFHSLRRVKQALNSRHNFLVINRFAAVQLGQAYLHLLPKPSVVLHISFYQFLHNLFRSMPGFRRDPSECGLQFRRKVNLQVVSLAPGRAVSIEWCFDCQIVKLPEHTHS